MRHLIALGLLGFASLVFALSVGSAPLRLDQVIAALVGAGDPLAQAVVWELRLPRALAGFLTGALLALAGVHMQLLLRNPLADPYVLGISGGATVATFLALLFGLSAMIQSVAAFAGALVSVILVFGVARGLGAWDPTRLLLTGVIIAAGWSALVSLLLSLTEDRQLQTMMFWLMGDLSHSQASPWAVLALVLTLGGSWVWARDLNLIARGGLQAAALGVAVGRIQLLLYLSGSLATAVAVTLAGSVGFVGLIVPHALRLAGARDHQVLLPGSVLLGGSLLVFADTVARVIVAPQQLPVGVITALLGVPVFLVLLHRSRPKASS
jgi:iron complex transport system permease protein